MQRERKSQLRNGGGKSGKSAAEQHSNGNALNLLQGPVGPATQKKQLNCV